MSEFLAARPELPQLVLLAAALPFCFWARNRALKPRTLAKTKPTQHATPG